MIGTSKGGDLALSVAAFIPTVRACVAINGCHGPLITSLRVGNELYHHVPLWDAAALRISDENIVMAENTNLHPNMLKDVVLPIEKSNAAYLFLVSSDDRDMKSELYAQDALKRLSEKGYTKHYEVSSYPGAGHLLEPPYSPHCRASLQHLQMLLLFWGGTSKYHTLGQENAWLKTIKFLWHHLVKECDPDCHTQPVLPVYSNNKVKSNL